MKNIHNRIKEVRSHFCKRRDANAEFAERVGESQATTSNWVSGSRGLGLDVVKKIIDAFPDVNGDWLLTGEGEMLKTSQPRLVCEEPMIEYGAVPSKFVEQLFRERERADQRVDRLIRIIETKLDERQSGGDFSKAN